MSLSVHGVIIIPTDPGIKTNITDKGAWINFRAMSDATNSWNCSVWVPLDDKDKWLDTILTPGTVLYVDHAVMEYPNNKFLKLKLDRDKVKKLKKVD